MNEQNLNQAVALSLLQSSGHHGEETNRPWGRRYYDGDFVVPLLRIWDTSSGSQPKADARMLSRAPSFRLDTLESRKTMLSIHANHSEWVPTPFISFTTSPTSIENLVYWREQRKRGSQSLTVVNPNCRIRVGLPILDMGEEMAAYSVRNPYSHRGYFKDHYLCLWEVKEREVVDTWNWEDLVAEPDWYNNIILPAYYEHEKNDIPKTQQRNPSDLLAAMANLSVDDSLEDLHTGSDGDSNRHEDNLDELGTGSEGEYYHHWQHDSDSDTDDEVEESNAADDIIRMIEANW